MIIKQYIALGMLGATPEVVIGLTCDVMRCYAMLRKYLEEVEARAVGGFRAVTDRISGTM